MKILDELSVDDRYTIAKPFLLFLLGILLSIIVLIAGAYCSIVKTDWTWFSRSGSLLVAIALLLAAVDLPGWMVNLLKIGSNNSSEEIKDTFKEIFRVDITKKIEQYGKSMTQEDIEFHASIMADNYRTNLPTRFSSHMKSIAQKVELIIAALGTLVWGFGDLPNMYI